MPKSDTLLTIIHHMNGLQNLGRGICSLLPSWHVHVDLGPSRFKGIHQDDIKNRFVSGLSSFASSFVSLQMHQVIIGP